MNISVVASSASSRAGSTRLQNLKIAAAYWRYSSPQASESPARTWDSNRAKSASLIVPVVLRSSIDLIRRLAANVSQLSQISGVVCEQMPYGRSGICRVALFYGLFEFRKRQASPLGYMIPGDELGVK